MLEIPESYNIAKQLNETISGKRISNVEANYSPHKFAWFFGDPENYNNLLSEKTITKIQNQSGIIEMHIHDERIVFSDGVNIRYLKNGEKLPKKHQLRIEFDDSSLLVCSIQMYGGLYAFKDGEFNNEYYLLAKTKPTPLSDEFTFDYFTGLTNSKNVKLSAKAFLATEQRIPGFGNGVLQDILFNCNINPRTKMNTLNDKEIECMYKSIKNTLFEMAEKGGRDTEKDIFGAEGGYKTILSKKTYKKPCTVCGSDIIKKPYLGGSVYYCPICQPDK